VIPARNYLKFDFKVKRIEKETESVYSIYITGRNIANFASRAGQFLVLRFLSPNLWWQAHPFSISKLPGDGELRVTVKSVGDFTSQIRNIKEGTSVIIEGPYGTFTSSKVKQNKVLFIAGGIGITPIRSLIEEMGQAGKDTVLLYSNRDKEGVVFEKELAVLRENHRLNIIYVSTQDSKSGGPAGRLDREKIQKLVPNVTERAVFICGPRSMLVSILDALKALNVPISQVRYEKFSL